MAKGGAFENEIAKKLSLWFTDGKRDDIFGRSDGSGSRFTSRWKKGKKTANQHGDITFADSIGEPLINIWSIEVKTGYSGKKKVTDADGDIVKIPIYGKRKTKNKNEERTIIGWKDKVSLAPWDALDFVDSNQKRPVLQAMWEQCAKDAELSGCEPILIFRRNARQSCICFRRSYYLSRSDFYGKCKSNIVGMVIDEENLVIMSLKSFFDWADPPSTILLP